jgi:hypothetical protein
MAMSGGNPTMLGQWRIIMRQAEEAARAGRLDEALELASRPDVAEQRLSVQLRAKWVIELMARASRRAQAQDTAGALADLDLAERHHAPPDLLAAARLKLADLLADELQSELLAGDHPRVIERVDSLERQHVQGPRLRRLREAAAAWKSALEEMRRGEFGLAWEALERAERLIGDPGAKALVPVRKDLESRQHTAAPRVERLYKALAETNWTEVLTAAELVLETVPDHPAARQARSRAWQEIGAIRGTAVLPPRSRPAVPDATQAEAGIRFLEQPGLRLVANPPDAPRTHAAGSAGKCSQPLSGLKGRALLWVDSVGGYLLSFGDRVILGRAAADSPADIPLMGDLSRHHAQISRSGDGYLIEARQPTFLNGRRIDRAALKDGDVIRLGASVELGFRLPSPVSATARLDLLSRHRLPLSVDGVILMAETCILGPGKQAHIAAPQFSAPVVLYRQGESLWCRAQGTFEVDGQIKVSRSALQTSSNVLGSDFSFSLEPLPQLQA